MQNKETTSTRYEEVKKNAKIAGIALLGVVIGVTYTYSWIEGSQVIQAIQEANSKSPNYQEITIVNKAKAETVAEASKEAPAKIENQAISDRDKIDQLIKKEFPAGQVEHARKVVWCESRYNAQAHNQNVATGDDSVGLGQINLLGNLFDGRLIRAQYLGYTGKPTREALTEWLKIPENNIKYLASMSETNGWSAWACHDKVEDPSWKYRDQMLAYLNQ